MPATRGEKTLSPAQCKELLEICQNRFDEHPERHKGVAWATVRALLEASPEKMYSLQQMEVTGGEPDLVGGGRDGRFHFIDCSPQTPRARVSVCYDREGLESRKEHRPKTTAMDMALSMGIELLTEEQYRELQDLGDFDTKTSSWIKTPSEIRKLGGALYGERRYGRVFIGHNGAQSCYSVRGFRGCLQV